MSKTDFSMPGVDAKAAPLYTLNVSQYELLMKPLIAQAIAEAIAKQPLPPPDLPDEIYIEEVAAITGRSLPTIYRNTSLRKIPHSKRGKQLVFSRRAIREWMESMTSDVPLLTDEADDLLEAVAEKRR